MKYFKKIYALIIAILLTLIPITFSEIDVYCDEGNSASIEQQLEETLDEQIQALDLGALNQFFVDFCDDQLGIWGTSSLLEKIQQIINGDFNDNSSFFVAIGKVILKEITSFLPLIASIIAIAILGSLLSELNEKNNSINNIVHFVCFGVIVTIILSHAVNMITLTSFVLESTNTQMEIVFPILLTLLTAIGGTVSVAVFQPAVALLTTVITKIFVIVLMPIFIFALVFTIISNISSSIKMDKLASFLSTLFKWVIGIVFTIFMGYLAIKGITAGSIDSISFKTARFSLSTYIPIVGGYLSEGLNLILASCLLIKNAIGTCGVLILFSTIFIPLLQIILFMFSLKFTGAVLQPINDNRISNFISSIAKVFIMPIVMIFAVAFIYVIFIGIIMCTTVSL